MRYSFSGIQLGIAFYICSKLIADFQRGFDLTDEGIYGLAAEQYSTGISFTSPFGAVTRVLYIICNQQLVVFRLIGFAILVLSYALFYKNLVSSICSFSRISKFQEYFESWPFSLFLAVASGYFYYGSGIFTPSYNWLNLVGILLGASGILYQFLAYAHFRKQNYSLVILAIFICWFGIILTAYSKFSSAIFLIISISLILVFIAANRKYSRLKSQLIKILLSGNLAASLGFLTLFLYDLRRRIEITRRIDVSLFPNLYNIPEMWRSFYSGLLSWPKQVFHSYLGAGWQSLVLPLGMISIFILKYSFLKLEKSRLLLRFIYFGLLVFYFVLQVESGLWNGHDPNSEDQFLSASALWLISMGVNILCLSWHKWSTQIPIILLAQIPISLSAVFAFGSADGIVIKQSSTVGLVFISTLINTIILFPEKLEISANLIAFVALFGACFSLSAMENHPYRQLPLAEQNFALSVGVGESKIYIDGPTGKQVLKLRQSMEKAGFTPSHWIVDGTGHNPGIIFLLRSRTINTIMPTWTNQFGSLSTFKESVLQRAQLSPTKNAPEPWFLISANGLEGTELTNDRLELNYISTITHLRYANVGFIGGISLWRPLAVK
jgi:hypothetical protein